ncbi:MutS domain III [Chitinophaga sp. CF118]|uniref:MutS-related protein n=1 Tax=Chitinophaga sp. CF118 TaxID=1884367 RepID=UPI0008DF0B0F|nr:hypothetical protein [Chitinophaga sp. CF118]SFE25871.1 MutS domain III [Chitinophaga sp. CF118]
MTPITIYDQQINDYKTEIAHIQQYLSRLGWLRLLCFLAALFCGYVYFRDSFDIIWLLPLALLAGGFIYALIKYQTSYDHLTLLKTLLELNEKEWRLAATGLSGFEEGESYTDEQHPYTGDLDVFGQSSLYGHMNRTGTLMGSRKLADCLRMPLTDVQDILRTQEAIHKLVPRLKFRQLLTAQASLAKEKQGDVTSLYKWLKLPLEFLDKKWLNIIRWVSPALLILSIVYYFISNEYYPITIFLCINWLILGSIVKRVNTQHQLISNKEKIFSKFALLLKIINDEKIEGATLLHAHKETAASANMALHQLARICNALDQRLNLLVGVFLNSFVLYDLHCAFAIERWKASYQEEVPVWMDVIAKMEALNSMATFAFNHPEYIYPQVNEDAPQLIAKGIGHPLIPIEDCVRNDISIGDPQNFLIITGSNMSGKSTFLRSVGSNLLLALCGMPVCAETFVCSPVRIMTSMRIKDSIAKHTSYFQAELLRLQQIVEVLKTGERVFILLDEILKGTNSEDKLSGSRKLIEHFLQYHCQGMIATHDLELGHLETTYPQKISNHCFESTIREDQLFFDYRIREGVARNKNATFLMQKMQII